MSRAPSVSIVLPTQGRCELLIQAIASVVHQTVADWELIIVDDASSDDTPAVAAAHAAADPRIRVLRTKHSTGAAAARNRGISLAKGRYVAFIDDDCAWSPYKLQRQIGLLEEFSRIGLVYCPYLLTAPDGSERVIGAHDVSGGQTRRALLRGNVIGTPVVVVRRELLETVGGFDERLQRFQDWDLWLRLSTLTDFGYDPEPLLRCFFVPGGISTRSDALASACRALSVKFEQELPLSRSELAEWHCTLGHILVLHGRLADGRNLLWRGVRSWPWPPRRLAMAGFALFGSNVYARVTGLNEWLRKQNDPADALARGR